MIRIAHILPWPTAGGTEFATLRIAKLVGDRGFEHIIYVLPGDHACRRMFVEAGFETREYVAAPPSWRHSRPWRQASAALGRDLRQREIALVHCADVLAAHHVAWAGRMARLPVLAHVRNRFAQISMRDRSFLVPVNRFVFVSRDTWARFAMRVSTRRGSVVYDGIDVPESKDGASEESEKRAVRAEFHIPHTATLVGVVARIAPQKDHETLIRAAARLAQHGPEFRYLLIGDHDSAPEWRDYYSHLRAAIAAAGLERQFIFTGHREDVRRLISALDLFALPTHQEGLPLVILEAMAMGKAVLATNVDGVPEIVSDGVTGLLHAHQDDAKLAAQLHLLACDPALASRLGSAGRERVKSSFSSDQFAHAMRSIYIQSAAGHSARRAS